MLFTDDVYYRYMKRINLIGRTFSRLTVIKQSGKASDGAIMWLCKCTCGKIKSIQGKALKNGSTKSCGCLHSEIAKTNRFKKRTIVCCVCNGSFESKVGPKIKTCSPECRRLRRLEYIHVLSRKDFEHVIKGLIKNSNDRARRHKLLHNITYEYLWNLFNKQDKKCAVTNQSFEISTGKGLKERSPWSVSIDRIDNSKGYIKGNVQLVTIMYNLCKNTWTHQDVITFSKSIIN